MIAARASVVSERIRSSRYCRYLQCTPAASTFPAMPTRPVDDRADTDTSWCQARRRCDRAPVRKSGIAECCVGGIGNSFGSLAGFDVSTALPQRVRWVVCMCVLLCWCAVLREPEDDRASHLSLDRHMRSVQSKFRHDSVVRKAPFQRWMSRRRHCLSESGFPSGFGTETMPYSCDMATSKVSAVDPPSLRSAPVPLESNLSLGLRSDRGTGASRKEVFGLVEAACPLAGIRH